MLLLPSNPLLSFQCPGAVQPAGSSAVRLERFPASAYAALQGQIGPLANCRSSSGCALVLRTDSPFVTIHLERLRHHQPTPCHLALEIQRGDERWEALSADLREAEGTLAVRLASGLERGAGLAVVSIYLPNISTCAVASVELSERSLVEPHVPPLTRWLAIGDSLTQGFIVSSPLQTWVHRLARRWNMPVANLGVGGIRIEPAVFAPALTSRTYDLVTIALGSNHAWRESEAVDTGARAAELAAIAAAGRHRRIAWLMPPWKPFESGKGPADFAGVPLDQEAAARMVRVRSALRHALSPFASRIQLVDDLMPQDYRLVPDGLHPQAYGAAKYASALAEVLEPPVPDDDGDTPAHGP
jgi:lysophospholipase L1-like esterase